MNYENKNIYFKWHIHYYDSKFTIYYNKLYLKLRKFMIIFLLKLAILFCIYIFNKKIITFYLAFYHYFFL